MFPRRTFLSAAAAGLAWPVPRLIAAEPSRSTTVKVAAVQAPSVLGDVAGNTARLSKLVEKAAAHGAKIVVLPETAITGYLSQDLQNNWHLPDWPLAKDFTGKDPLPFAQIVPGPATEHFCALAKRLGIYLTIPLLERDDTRDKTPRLFNTVALASPQGKLVAHYRKLTPWPHPEQSWATAGDRGVQTYDTEYGRVGLAICFDIHTILKKYEPHKLWALLYPIAWVDGTHPAEWFWHTLPQRVAPYQHHVIGANWSLDAPPAKRWYGYGFSTIIASGGEVAASAKSLYGAEIVYAELPRS